MADGELFERELKSSGSPRQKKPVINLEFHKIMLAKVRLRQEVFPKVIEALNIVSTIPFVTFMS